MVARSPRDAAVKGARSPRDAAVKGARSPRDAAVKGARSPRDGKVTKTKDKNATKGSPKKSEGSSTNMPAQQMFLGVKCSVPGKTIPEKGICVKDNVTLESVVNAWSAGMVGCDLPLEAHVYGRFQSDRLDVKKTLQQISHKLPARGGRHVVSISMDAKHWERLCKAKEAAMKAAEEAPKREVAKPQKKKSKVVPTPPLMPRKQRIYGDAKPGTTSVDDAAAAAAFEELLS